MQIINDIKIKINSELTGFGFSQLNLPTVQNDFSNFQRGWWQFCWINGVINLTAPSQFLYDICIEQFTVCATQNLSFFVAISPRCFEWSSMVVQVAVSRALPELWGEVARGTSAGDSK